MGKTFAQAPANRRLRPRPNRRRPQPKEVSVGDFIIAEPIQCKNLTVFPVLSTKPKEEDRYITLEEGLKSHKVDVYEVGASPSSDSNRQNAPPNPSQPPVKNVQKR